MTPKQTKTEKDRKVKLNKLVLFDAHALVHRAYHALPDFASSKGEPTGALYGLSTMLIKAIADLKPDYMAACYDRAEATFRKDVYEGYKATRKKIDEELISQLERSREVFQAFNIPIYDKAGFEADDMIGTIVEQTKKIKNLEIIIVTGDMDTLQLVSGRRVQVFTLKKGINDTVMYDEGKVLERYGFGPEHIADFKGLRGDPSDNIIGIEGIGEKTAADLILKFGSIENMYKILAKGDGEFIKAGFKPRIIELLRAGNDEAIFSKMLATIRHDAPIDFVLPEKSWQDAVTIEPILKLFNELDFKSLGARVKVLFNDQGVLSGVSSEEEASETSTQIFDPLEVKKVGIALWLIDSDKTTPTIEDILDYAGTKDFDTARKVIMADLKKNNLEKVYIDIELPLIEIIDRAEKRGILIDKKVLADMAKDYHQKLSEIEKKIFSLAGSEFNINSPKQLGEILFDKLNISLKGLRKTAGGARSTRESELVKIKEAHPIIEEVLTYREYQKLLSTYIDNLPAMLDADSRLHTTLNQAGTTTGRMSSTNPNLQNIPARGDNGSAIRKAFVATSGYHLAAFDYSQIEMRVLAMLSGDEHLIKVFNEGQDVHTSVASIVFNVPPAEVTKDMRRKAKVINFGIIYGMGVNALKTNLGGTREEAEKFYDDYFRSLPKVQEYFEKNKQEAQKKGYTETYFGRRRYFPDLKSSLPFVRSMAERMAMNAPLQGTAADIVKIAIIKVDEELKKYRLEDQVFLLLQIHDELLFEIKAEAVETAIPLIEKAMETAVLGPVPFRVNYGVGQDWGELK